MKSHLAKTHFTCDGEALKNLTLNQTVKNSNPLPLLNRICLCFLSLFYSNLCCPTYKNIPNFWK